MLLLKLFRFILGYVRFKAMGDFPERFLNICAKNSISVWNIRRSNGVITACVFIKDYKKMRKVRAKCGVRLKILNKHGLPFIMKKYNKRLGFLIGVIIFFVVLNIMTMFVWNINIVGNKNISTESIMSALGKLGVKEGSLIKSVDAANARQRLMIELEGIAWAAINIEGTKATVDITEVMQVPEEKGKAPCNLKAAMDGRILALEITEGKIIANLGDAVVVGDLLVSGILEYKTGETSFKRAAGKVLAETNRSLSFTATYEQTEIVQTGKIQRRSVVDIFGIKVPLYLGTIKGEYEKVIMDWRYESENAYLPITVTTADFYETIRNTKRLSEEQALNLAREEIKMMEENQLKNVEIISKDEVVERKENGVNITMNYVCRENIAVEEILLINTTN